MPAKESVRLGPVQETMLIPLIARALESLRESPIVSDPKAIEIADSIDWDFSRFTQRPRVLACVLRAAIFDQWVRDFLRWNPAGTVVEIGAGLSTRFERLDNGTARWFDLDLPDAVELRGKFLGDSAQHTTIAGSVVDGGWMEAVRCSPGPYLIRRRDGIRLPARSGSKSLPGRHRRRLSRSHHRARHRRPNRHRAWQPRFRTPQHPGPVRLGM